MMTHLFRKFDFSILVAMIPFLFGCIAGQSIRMVYTPEMSAYNNSGSKVSVDVVDDRPYVKSGEKSLLILDITELVMETPGMLARRVE